MYADTSRGTRCALNKQRCRQNMKDSFVPRYIKALHQGWLSEKINQAAALLSDCTLCPRQCRVDRTKQATGFCVTGSNAVVSSWGPHFGEEPQLVGGKGSGTLFFSHCNLKCVFCQNYDISVNGMGQEATDGQIASIMLSLQESGCHNINLVTPSHVVPQILKAVDIAAGHGLNIPLVYNCSGYESLSTLKILNGVIDLYLPDFKFWDAGLAGQYCHARDYPEIAQKAILEMADQVGALTVDHAGIACSGLMVRHLVMPGNLEGTRHILTFLKQTLPAHTPVNLMSQYRPMGAAHTFKQLSRPLTPEEFRTAVHMARTLDLDLV